MSFNLIFLLYFLILFITVPIFTICINFLKALVIYWLVLVGAFLQDFTHYVRHVFHNNIFISPLVLFLLELGEQRAVFALLLSLLISTTILFTLQPLPSLLSKANYWVTLKYVKQFGLAISLYYWIMLIHALFFYVFALVTFLLLLSSTLTWFYFKLTLLWLHNKTTSGVNSTFFSMRSYSIKSKNKKK